MLGECREALGARAAVLVITAQNPQEAMVRTEGLGDRGPAGADEPVGPLGDTLRTGEPTWLGSEGRWRRRYPGWSGLGAAVRAIATLPLTLHEESRGVLALGYAAERRFRAEERLAALALAYQCGLALDRARLYERERHTAQTLQRSLLPPDLPAVPGLQVAVRFRPALEGDEVGGDFYDLFALGERGWCVVIGDVCGKGPDAAGLTALARYTIRAETPHARGPAEVLERLNRSILAQRRDGRFLTACCAWLFPTGEGFDLLLARAGHPAPLLLDADGAVTALEPDGTLLGVLADVRLVEQRTRFLPGQTLVLLTDGVSEAGSPHEQFGDEALQEVLRAGAGLGAEALASSVERRLEWHRRRARRDDVVLLVLRVASAAL
jgi:serine phosphatase RsbU (regulator of sigma subunit)